MNKNDESKYTPVQSLTGMPWNELQDWVEGELLERPFRTRQLFSWIHHRGAESFNDMTDIPKALRERLSECAALTVLETIERADDDDGTQRFLLRLPDGLVAESVLIPDPPRLTACLSTQVGCKMKCAFCMTGQVGFRRNLSSHEITAQLYALRKASQERISNVVLMGMGEPLDNLDQVLPALLVISHDSGICIGQRKITISTIGLPGGIEKLSKLGRQYGLALSLHSAVTKTREMLVPAAAATSLHMLKQRLMEWTDAVGRRVTLEYCLIAGVNDSEREADALADFAQGLPCKINLLLYNRVAGLPWKRPDERAVSTFMARLFPRCPAVTLRKSRGSDVQGACGQLGASVLGSGTQPEKQAQLRFSNGFSVVD